VEGVIRTRVGYAGGEKASPSYHAMGDHTETVQVDYDPNRITYAQLLDIFWSSHRPTSRNWSRQYMKAVFFHDDQQQREALASKANIEQKIGRTVKTGILPVQSFTLAEKYHQKYILKGHKVLNGEMSRIYPAHSEFVDSTAVARLNGYVGNNGTREQLGRELDILGLDEHGRRVLEGLVD
jgi:peptide-methionine (S)-S-oxide reductase